MYKKKAFNCHVNVIGRAGERDLPFPKRFGPVSDVYFGYKSRVHEQRKRRETTICVFTKRGPLECLNFVHFTPFFLVRQIFAFERASHKCIHRINEAVSRVNQTRNKNCAARKKEILKYIAPFSRFSHTAQKRWFAIHLVSRGNRFVRVKRPTHTAAQHITVIISRRSEADAAAAQKTRREPRARQIDRERERESVRTRRRKGAFPIWRPVSRPVDAE